jgi:sugar lactone lactonase YvrE
MERALSVFSVAGLALLLSVPARGVEPVSWNVGDVFVAVGEGAYQVYDRHGGPKYLLQGEQGGYTTDCAFNPDLDKLYTANYTYTQVIAYGDQSGHPVVQTIEAGEASPEGHSNGLVFDAEGHLFVGHPDGNGLIHKYSPAGLLLETYQVQADRRGSHWIDLASDQATVFYTSQGRTIRRFDTRANEQREVFAELPGEGHAFALRLLPPGDGAGGLLVADESDIKRLDGNGRVVQVYDAQAQDNWFALNLDPDGRSFWAADNQTDRLYRFDLTTGRIEQQFEAGPGQTLFGVCVKGELRAGLPPVESALPSEFSLGQNVPNPFNPTTQISYALPRAGAMSLVIYNLLGQQVRVLEEGDRPAGMHRRVWDGRDDYGRELASGVYFYRLVSQGWVETRRMLLLK